MERRHIHANAQQINVLETFAKVAPEDRGIGPFVAAADPAGIDWLMARRM